MQQAKPAIKSHPLRQAAAQPLRQILAMGGGGFTAVPRNPLLDEYFLKLTRKKRPRVCFIGTATGDRDEYIEKFHAAYGALGAVTTHLPLFARDAQDPRDVILAQDAIYVGGGNTANMLAIWRIHGVDRALREAWRRGIVLGGISAGMNCWFERCSTDSYGPLRLLDDGLGLLPGLACPHYDAEEHRRPTLRTMIEAGAGPAFAADNGAAFHFIGRRLYAAVAALPAARCYAVRLARGKFAETALPTRFLGKAK
jgi:dipeptidase E